MAFFTLIIGTVGCGRSTPTPPPNMTAMNARTKLLQRIGDINNPETPKPLVTLEEFFEGNDDFGSIGYNFYPDQPAPSEFYEHFKAIRDRPEVADVRVEVMDLQDPDGWPTTDAIWVISSASPDRILEWVGDRFRPDDLVEGFPSFYPIEPYDVPEAMKAYGVWWD